MNNDIVFVTGLWDIGRNALNQGWSRDFNHYLDKLQELMKMPYNMIIYGDDILEEYVFKHRTNDNTQFIRRSKDFFTNNEYYPLIQSIRLDDRWKNQVGWLKDSTQSMLELYNPLVMSKMFLLNDARILSKFKCTHMFWIDAGITNTVHGGYFREEQTIDRLATISKDFLFVCFPYETTSEIHGFEFKSICNYAKQRVNRVARGGVFGGNISAFHDLNAIYYNLLMDTLRNGYMGTEESLFTIMTYLYPDKIAYATIEDNGLVGKFFEDLKNDKVIVCREKIKQPVILDKTALYVISFNSPKQFRVLIESWCMGGEFISRTKNYLLDNSTDSSTTEEYKEICAQYNFEHIKKNNIGICGGRQFIAEHFETTGLDYYIFLEDDMLLISENSSEIFELKCKNGFTRVIPNLYNVVHKIMANHDYDFLKFSFSEFYGDNRVQWAWYNVPQKVRDEVWPHKSKLPEKGLDPDAPRMLYKNIHSMDGVAYADGEIYYCNWPQIVSKKGNRRMFLDTKWQHPFEQTWMSHMFQITRKGELNPAVLLASPINHNRFEHYSGSLRREN